MSSIETAKRCAGWQHPYDRNACRNCAHGKTINLTGDIGKIEWRCARHGFYTTALAVCTGWEQRK